MNRILARRALLDTGWADDVLLGIRDGEIAEVSKGVPAPPAADLTAGIVIPGLTNAHSHAFQRALAGRTEHRSGAGAIRSGPGASACTNSPAGSIPGA